MVLTYSKKNNIIKLVDEINILQTDFKDKKSSKKKILRL
jgi:hypothetical protein